MGDVLIVDDDRMNLIILEKLVCAMGVEVATCSSGAQALEELQATAWRVVLLDMQMPEMDGPETARRIRALGEAISQPKIVALTAFVDESVQQTAHAAGMDAVMSKPLDRSALQRVLDTANL